MTSATTPSSPARTTAPARPTGRAVWHRPALTIDAAGCAVIGIVLLAAPAALRDGFAATTPTPLRLVGAGFLVAAAVNAWAARADGRVPTYLAVDLDVFFAGVALVLLLTASGDVAGWVRVLLVAGIAVPAGFATVKVLGLRPRAAGPAGAGPRRR